MTFDLRGHGQRPALLAVDEAVTYAKLADRVEALVTRLGTSRRLVVLRGRTSVDFVVALTAALTGGHPVIVAPPLRSGQADDIRAIYNPDVVIDTDRPGDHVVSAREASVHDLHPDLALLMSTSGSTGSPKLVRLSRSAVRSNAAAIATYLDLTGADRGILSLPLHYCYGLSVLTSHLYAGATAIVTDWSVLDPCLWDLAAEHGATGLAGVPHTFDQLDQVGFPDIPSLRYVTAAGGKLAAERVTDLVGLGRSRGWDFFVMYGQTEATARMAYLPPKLADEYPQAVGVAIAGGHLRIADTGRTRHGGVGELVYSGPNVMMGYAHGPADLAAGPHLAELRTGDLAREVGPGIFEVVSRKSRFAKVFGLRLDLDEIERRLPSPAACVEVDGGLGVISPDPDAAERVAELCDVPTWVIQGVVAEVPRLPSGKPDRQTVAALMSRDADANRQRPASVGVRELYERLLGHERVQPGDSFVSLGADSLSYVELSVRLGEIIDPLPRDWHRCSVAELDGMARAPRRARASTPVNVDPTVLLRAIAIVLIVATHANLLTVMGGAHALLAVCGYNAARFLPTGQAPARALLRGAWRIALPSSLWIGTVALWGGYAPTTAVFLNGALGANHWTIDWQFWFLEAAIWTLVGLAAALAIPPFRRLEASHPFTAAMVLLTGTAALRYALVGVDAGPLERYSVPVVAWCFVLGWAAARAEANWQRVVVILAAGLLLFNFFGNPMREVIIGSAVAVLLWAKPVPLPRWAATTCSAVAGASLAIYLTHWQVYPHLEDRYPLAATLASLVVGLAYHRMCVVVGRATVGVRRRIAVDIDRRIQRRTDEHGDRQDIEQEQHGNGRGQRTVDGRAHSAEAQDPAHEIAAQDPHHDREERARKAGTPRLPHGHRQVIQRRHEPDREHQYERPVGTP
jgi:acyl-CoA synthetase (AMP-forming)/AMP-acid ligase II